MDLMDEKHLTKNKDLSFEVRIIGLRPSDGNSLVKQDLPFKVRIIVSLDSITHIFFSNMAELLWAN